MQGTGGWTGLSHEGVSETGRGCLHEVQPDNGRRGKKGVKFRAFSLNIQRITRVICKKRERRGSRPCL